MPKDPSASSTTTATTGSGSPSSASAAGRAQEMRARLGVQRDAEELLVEASQLRRSAAQDADAIVAEAETLATQLVAEAQERADGILARAYNEAEDLQRHTEEERARIRDEVVAAGRAEIEEFRTRSAGSLDRAEGGLRQLAPTLEDAVTTVAAVLLSLEELRAGPVEGSQLAVPALPTAIETTTGTGVAADTEQDADDEADRAEAMVAEGAPPTRSTVTRADDPEARPLGWLFRASQS
jgi:vacuolar-type H+-ATPase subunit H